MGALQRIKEYIEYKGLTNQKFEKEVGFSNGAFSSQLKNNRTIGVDKLENILIKFPELNSNWVLTGIGNMLNSEVLTNIQEPQGVYKLRTDIDVHNQEIPLYNIEASAGLVELFQSHQDQTPIDTIRIPNLPKCDGALFVTGDSMYPLLKSGDIVAYKQIYDKQNEIFWGEMYLVSVEVSGEEFVSVKYIQKSELGSEYIKLVSQNTHHQPKDVLLDKVRALALIKASIRINSMK